MKLTIDQEKAYDAIMKWILKGDSWCYKLAGYAGTGKTTLLQYIISGLEESPICCAPTGKAASVLGSKLGPENLVITVHQALYSPVSPCMAEIQDELLKLKSDPDNQDIKAKILELKDRMKQEKLSFSSKLKHNEYKGSLFIVDESSMITPKMAEDFKYSGAKVLFVGDPGQLPPVKNAQWFREGNVDLSLTSVMRQALDNPIIRLSMDIRNNRFSNLNQYGESGEVNITNKENIDIDEWMQCDQVLTGSNYLRRKINRFFRKKKGYEGQLPVNNEKLICLKNDFQKHGLINGIPATCLESAYMDEDGNIRMSVLFEDQVKSDLSIYSYPFESHYGICQEEPWMMRSDLSEFDWAYAITVHKSQGSEWRNVLLADDGFLIRNGTDRQKWLYTAVTRAKDKFTWVKD